jgi:hypothetical protein
VHGTPVSTPPQHGTTQSWLPVQTVVPHTMLVPVLVSAGPESIGTVPLLLPLLLPLLVLLPLPLPLPLLPGCVGVGEDFWLPPPLLPIGSLMPPDETSPGPPEQAKMSAPMLVALSAAATILCFLMTRSLPLRE